MSTEHPIDVEAMGERAYRRRRELDLDQQQVADLAEMSREYISRLETASSRNPKIRDLERVATALGKPLNWLLYGDDPPLTEEEEADLARLEPQFKNLAFATGRRYEKGTPEEKRQMLAILKALAGEEYREPVDDDA